MPSTHGNSRLATSRLLGDYNRTIIGWPVWYQTVLLSNVTSVPNVTFLYYYSLAYCYLKCVLWMPVIPRQILRTCQLWTYSACFRFLTITKTFLEQKWKELKCRGNCFSWFCPSININVCLDLEEKSMETMRLVMLRLDGLWILALSELEFHPNILWPRNHTLYPALLMRT